MAGIEQQRSPAERAGDWVRDEWSTVAGVVHSLASVPGVLARERVEASVKSRNLARTIDHVAGADLNWYDRGTAAQALAHAAGRDPRVRGAVETLARSDPHAPLGNAARSALHDYAHTLRRAAESMDQRGYDRVSHSGVAKSLPIAGVVLAGLATLDDVERKHVDAGTALAANAAGTVAGTAAGIAVEAGVTLAIAGGTVAAAPAVAVVAGVIAATAIGYAVTHAIEAKAAPR